MQPLPLSDAQAPRAVRSGSPTTRRPRTALLHLRSLPRQLHHAAARSHRRGHPRRAATSARMCPTAPPGATFVRRGFSAEPGLLALSEPSLLGPLHGRPSDPLAGHVPSPTCCARWSARTSTWPPLVIAERGGPPVDGPPLRGRAFLVWLAILLAAVSGFLVAIGHRVTRGLGLGAPWPWCSASSRWSCTCLPYYWKIRLPARPTRRPLVLLPTDFAPARLPARPASWRLYLDVRLSMLTLVALLSATGILVSPLGPVIGLRRPPPPHAPPHRRLRPPRGHSPVSKWLKIIKCSRPYRATLSTHPWAGEVARLWSRTPAKTVGSSAESDPYFGASARRTTRTEQGAP